MYQHTDDRWPAGVLLPGKLVQSAGLTNATLGLTERMKKLTASSSSQASTTGRSPRRLQQLSLESAAQIVCHRRRAGVLGSSPARLICSNSIHAGSARVVHVHRRALPWDDILEHGIRRNAEHLAAHLFQTSSPAARIGVACLALGAVPQGTRTKYPQLAV